MHYQELQKDTTSYPLEWLNQRQMVTGVRENMQKLEPSYMVDEKVKWYSHFGK